MDFKFVDLEGFHRFIGWCIPLFMVDRPMYVIVHGQLVFL